LEREAKKKKKKKRSEKKTNGQRLKEPTSPEWQLKGGKDYANGKTIEAMSRYQSRECEAGSVGNSPSRRRSET